MNDLTVAVVIRRVRLRLGRTQKAASAAAGVSQSTWSRAERGHIGTLRLETIRAIGRSLDIRIDLVARWRSGDLDRMLGAAHASLHDEVARLIGRTAGWRFEPEVSFSIWGERGSIDILAWHAQRRVLLVIELKTEIVDLNELLGTLDRKVRLAPEIARQRGWAVPVDGPVSAWVIASEGRTSRRRVQGHAAMVRAALPDDGRSVAGWLIRPRRSLRCLSFWPHPPARSRSRDPSDG